MTDFSIAVYDRNKAAILIPGSLDVRPQSWSAIARGGMWDAEVALEGGLSDLAGLTAWLGYSIDIINEHGTVVWWGDIQTIEIVSSGLRRGISLDRMANRIQIRYSQLQAGGAVSAADTVWTDDADSQTRFGIWERRISPDRELTTSQATYQLSTALNVLSEPHKTLRPEAGKQSARLFCTGFWQRNKRLYYARAAGLEEHVDSGAAYPLGLGFTASTVAFATRTDAIWDAAGNFALFPSGTWVKVTGAANGGNNSTFEVTGTDDREATTYVATTISFDPNDDIMDSEDKLSFIEVDDVIVITGSASNNDTYIVKTAGAGHIEISPSMSGNTVSEAAGASVSITRGNHIDVGANLVNEAVGSSVTVTAYGQRYYQTFGLGANLAWTVASVEIRCRKVGTPGDGITIQLVDDSSGSPSTVLDSVTVDADDIPTEMGWVSFTMSNLDSLSYGTTYGLVVLRSGANNAQNFYEIELDEEAGYSRGALKWYDGAAYNTPSPVLDMAFRVLGGIDTGTQMGDVLRGAGWAVSVDDPTTGIVTNQYRAGELTAFDELEALFDVGTSGGFRVCARTTRDMSAIVYVRPTSGSTTQPPRFTWHDGNRLTDMHGQDADPGMLPAGEWVHLGDTADLGPWAALSPVFVERAEYRVGQGITIEPEGDEDVWSTGVMQG